MKFLCCFILLGGAWFSQTFAQVFHPSDSLKCCLFKSDSAGNCCPLLNRIQDTVRISSEFYDNSSVFSVTLRLPENEMQLQISGNAIFDEATLWMKYGDELLFEACCEYEQYIIVIDKSSGKRKFEGKFNGEHFVGSYKEYYKNGSLKCTGEYGRQDYSPSGTWKFYKKNGGQKKVKLY